MSKTSRYDYKEHKLPEEFKRPKASSGNLEPKGASNKEVAKLSPVINSQLDKLYKIWLSKDTHNKSLIMNKFTVFDQQCQRVSVYLYKIILNRNSKKFSSEFKTNQSSI